MATFKDLGGCPCGTHGKCCSDPEITTPEHDEPHYLFRNIETNEFISVIERGIEKL